MGACASREGLTTKGGKQTTHAFRDWEPVGTVHWIIPETHSWFINWKEFGAVVGCCSRRVDQKFGEANRSMVFPQITTNSGTSAGYLS